MPFPGTTLPRMFASPDPAYTTFGSEGATAIDPIVEVAWSSKMALNVSPPSVDFQMPPDAVAA